MNLFFDRAGKVRYSSVRASNSKWLLLEQPDGYIHLYTIQGEFVRVLPQVLRTDTEVVFDWINPDLVYYTSGNSLMQYDLSGPILFGEVMEFPQFEKLSAHGAEGDLTPRGYLALNGVDKQGVMVLFVFNIYTKQIVGDPQPQVHAFDGRKVTDRGVLLISDEASIVAIPPHGQEYVVAEANGHALASTYEDRDVLLWCTNGRRRGWINALEIVDIIDPSKTKILFDVGKLHYAMQLSQGPGDTVIMCLYDDELILPFQIWQVHLGGQSSIKLHEWTAQYRDYDSSPKASYSDGHIFYNFDDGSTIKVNGLRMDGVVAPALSNLTRIDYSPYVGKSRFIMVPRADGAVDIFEEKL